MGQKEKIIDYMKEAGSITALDAMREFGCMRLAARIADLKEEGWKIEATPDNGRNRYGEKVHFTRYKLMN